MIARIVSAEEVLTLERRLSAQERRMQARQEIGESLKARMERSHGRDALPSASPPRMAKLLCEGGTALLVEVLRSERGRHWCKLPEGTALAMQNAVYTLVSLEGETSSGLSPSQSVRVSKSFHFADGTIVQLKACDDPVSRLSPLMNHTFG
jgi:hypothetical protein